MIAPSKTKGKEKTNSTRGKIVLIRALYSVGIFLMLSALIFICTQSNKDAEPEAKESTKNNLITEVDPAPAQETETVVTAEEEQKTPSKAEIFAEKVAAITEDTPIEEFPEGVHRAGILMLNGKQITPRKLFKTRCENYLAAFLTIKPGDRIIEMPLSKDFDMEFVQSMHTKIEITEDDTEEEAEIKRQMIALKEDLKQFLKEGGSIRELVIEERKNLNRIADMKDMFQHGLSDLQKSGASIEDIQDYLEASKLMLEKEGSTPLHINKKLRAQLEEYYDSQANK